MNASEYEEIRDALKDAGKERPRRPYAGGDAIRDRDRPGK